MHRYIVSTAAQSQCGPGESGILGTYEDSDSGCLDQTQLERIFDGGTKSRALTGVVHQHTERISFVCLSSLYFVLPSVHTAYASSRITSSRPIEWALDGVLGFFDYVSSSVSWVCTFNLSVLFEQELGRHA